MEILDNSITVTGCAIRLAINHIQHTARLISCTTLHSRAAGSSILRMAAVVASPCVSWAALQAILYAIALYLVHPNISSTLPIRCLRA